MLHWLSNSCNLDAPGLILFSVAAIKIETANICMKANLKCSNIADQSIGKTRSGTHLTHAALRHVKRANLNLAAHLLVHGSLGVLLGCQVCVVCQDMLVPVGSAEEMMKTTVVRLEHGAIAATTVAQAARVAHQHVQC